MVCINGKTNRQSEKGLLTIILPVFLATIQIKISVSLLGPSKQSSALVMRPFEFKVTSEKHNSVLVKITTTVTSVKCNNFK